MRKGRARTMVSYVVQSCLPVERFPSGLFEPKHHVDAVVAGNWLDVAWHLGCPAQHGLNFHGAH